MRGVQVSSYMNGKREIVAWVNNRFPDATILDVGACDGIWRTILPNHTMDAVEAFKPNADRLKGYRAVYNCDIANFSYDWYDLIIFGDVIEHMGVEQAQRVLKYAESRCRDMIVAVPYCLKQGEIYGNPYEVHIQDDLTPKIFDDRYPGFEPLYMVIGYYCYYHKESEPI